MGVHLFPGRRAPCITIQGLAGRFGRFVIPDMTLELWPDSVQAVMGECIVLAATHCRIEGLTLYTAVSAQFEVRPDQAPVPFYLWRLSGPKPVAERLRPESGDAA